MSLKKQTQKQQEQPNLNDFITQQREKACFSGLPLEGKRVIDLSSVVAAPYCAALLGDAGAEIIKVENPMAPDALRGWGTHAATGIEPYHAYIGRNKLPITLNLKSDAGKQAFLELIKSADVLIENMRLGVMDRLGLSHQALLELNPGLIIGKVSGYGMTGPHAHQPGFGTLAEAFSGFSFLNGYEETGPTSPPIALADLTTGIHLAYAVSLALHQSERSKSGGQVVDISLYEPLFGYLGGEFIGYQLTGQIPQPIGNELRAAAPRNNYQTSDGLWVAMSCSNQKTWERLAEVMGQPQLIRDPRFKTNNDRIQADSRIALNQIIKAWVLSKTNQEALELFRREGITAGPIMSMKEIDEDPHYEARGSIIRVTDPVSGVELKMPDVPFRMGDNSDRNKKSKLRFPGLPMGSANQVVYRDLLGYNQDQIDQLG
jgi:formyl-CoA transferase|tara:strand:+ start:79 stop:1371 length:1293 start_codon:yes stop_codon:yes gene_type:complete